MTYIKWKDEVESYLVNLSQEEKQKIFSYFSEMYADKRDAGKSEAQIIEEFGAPYDVAKRILADSRDASGSAAANGANASQPSGGNNGGGNYNYNYYNYNYGSPPPARHEEPAAAPPCSDPFAKGIPMPPPARQKRKCNAAQIVFGIIFGFLLTVLSIALIGSAIAVAVDGFVSIGFTAGALAAGQCGGAEGATMIGYGLVLSGVGITLLAPFSALCSALWRGLKKFVKGA